MTRIAMCTACGGEPLVGTFAFSRAEFICLGCGRLYGFLEPAGADETPELLAVMEERKQEWIEHGGAILGHGVMLKGCADAGGPCVRGESHILHATPAEKAAHEQALEWVRQLRERETV